MRPTPQALTRSGRPAKFRHPTSPMIIARTLMAHRLNPYINFTSEARAAMDFYTSVFGGKLKVMTFKEGGMAEAGADGDRIMHAQLETPNGMTLMASDTPPG